MSLRLERMIAIDTMIRRGNYPSIQTFIERFEVSERTVRADLAFMRERLNAPLRHHRVRGGYHYADPAWVLPQMFVTEGELLAFFLSVELARRYLGTVFETPLRKAVENQARSLPDEVQLDLGLLTQHYSFQSGATIDTDPVLLVALNEAMTEHWRIDIRYFTASTGEWNQRTIEPYHMYNVRGDWQIIAFDHLRQQFRNFAVSRIKHWSVQKSERFTRDSGFSPTVYLAHGFLAERGDTAVEVVVWFDDYQARYIRGRQIHPSQQTEEHPDGTLTLRFQSGALAEVRRWVMSFGSHALVHAPASLAAEVAAEAAKMVQRYSTVEKSP